MKTKVRTLLVVAFFAAVVAALFHDVLVEDRVLITSNTSLWSPWRSTASMEDLSGRTYRTDAARTYLPRRVELSRSIASGRLPLWSPDVFAGYPFFADPQSRVLYPVSLLLVPVDPQRALGYDVAVHFLIAMVGMYFFVKAAGGTALGGMISGLAYGLSSFFFLRTGHPTFVASASYIPWMFFAYERSKVSRRSGGLLLIGFMALGYLAGMTQIFMFGVAALVIYALEEGVEGLAGGDRFDPVGKLGLVFAAGAIGALVVGVSLVPFVELIRHSSGMSFSYDLMRDEHLWKPVFLLRSFAPDFFGNPVEGTSWVGLVKGVVHPFNSGFHVYCGAGSLALAVAGLTFLKRSRHMRGLLLLLALAVGLATSAVVLKVVYTVFPPAAYSQVDRVSVIACFALAGIAGIGVSIAGKTEAGAGRRLYGAVVVALALAVFAGYLVFVLRGAGIFSHLISRARPLAGEAWFQRGGFKVTGWVREGWAGWLAYEKLQVGLGVLFTCLAAVLVTVYLRWRGRAVAIAAGALLLVTLAADLLIASRRYYVSQPAGALRRTAGIEYLQEKLTPPGAWRAASLVYLSNVFPPNLPEVFGIPTFEGQNAIVPAAHARRVAWARGSGDALGAMGTATGRLGDLMAVRFFIGDRATAEAGYATGFRPVYEGDLNIYDNPDVLPKGICIDREIFAPAGRLGPVQEIKLAGHLEDLHVNLCGSAAIERYAPEEVVLSVEAESACIFIFQDNYYPGWKAYVDGREAPILKTDMGIRALELERGRHRVRMVYSPGSLKLGLLLTAAGLVLSLVYAIKAKNPRA